MVTIPKAGDIRGNYLIVKVEHRIAYAKCILCGETSAITSPYDWDNVLCGYGDNCCRSSAWDRVWWRESWTKDRAYDAFDAFRHDLLGQTLGNYRITSIKHAGSLNEEIEGRCIKCGFDVTTIKARDYYLYYIRSNNPPEVCDQMLKDLGWIIPSDLHFLLEGTDESSPYCTCSTKLQVARAFMTATTGVNWL